MVLKLRDPWRHWVAPQVPQRRHLIAQPSRFLVLAGPGKWPNGASRVLKLAWARLPADWQQRYGYPVLAVETFVDPPRFRGTGYTAAGGEVLGPTQGNERHWQDFYTDCRHPKELWVHPLSAMALEQLRAPELAVELAEPARALAPACPVAPGPWACLQEYFRCYMTDPRKRKGLRHKLAGCLTSIALARVAGCKGPQAIAEFAFGLNHAHRRGLHCRPRLGHPRAYDVAGECTFRRLLKKVDPEQLKTLLRAALRPLWRAGSGNHPKALGGLCHWPWP